MLRIVQLLLLTVALLLNATQAEKCSFKTTVTASSALSSLGSCETLSGTIEISGEDISNLDLSSVKEVAADLHLFNSTAVQNVNFHNLEKISGSLKVESYTQMHTIDFSSLDNVSKLSLISLPSFSVWNLGRGVSKIDYLEVSDTSLSSLEGVNIDEAGTIDINNNKNFSEIDLGVRSASENLIVSFNSDDAEVKLDKLKWASNLTIQDVSHFSALNLSSVNGSMLIGYNKFDHFELESLKNIGGSLQVFGNDDLTDFQIEKLTSVGGELKVFNNSELEDLEDTFKKLKTIGGAVNIKGKFDNFTLPALEKVDGDFNVASTSSEFSCDDFDKAHKNKIEGHKYTCKHGKKKKKGSKSSSSSESSGSGDYVTSSGSDGKKGSESSSSSSKKSDANGMFSGKTLIYTILGVSIASLF